MHLNGYAHAVLPFDAPVVVVAHSCVCSWYRAVRGDVPDTVPLQTYRQRVAAGLDAADEVVAPTAAMMAALLREYGPLPRASVVWNGRSRAPFASGPKLPVVFAAGRVWDDAKNLRLLAQVAPRLGWPVRIAGPLTDDRGFEHAVMLGRLPGPAVAQELAHASIYALPARYEPFGLSALEAAFAGCALVLGDIPSLRELWDGDALFVAPDDPDGLERALCTLMNDAPLRTTFGRKAAARASRYTMDGMVAGYLARYAALPSRREDRARCAS